MRHTHYDRLYYYFRTDCGQFAVTRLYPRKGLTKADVLAEAEKLIRTYRTKKGARLLYFKRAVIKHEGIDAIR